MTTRRLLLTAFLILASPPGLSPQRHCSLIASAARIVEVTGTSVGGGTPEGAKFLREHYPEQHEGHLSAAEKAREEPRQDGGDDGDKDGGTDDDPTPAPTTPKPSPAPSPSPTPSPSDNNDHHHKKNGAAARVAIAAVLSLTFLSIVGWASYRFRFQIATCCRNCTASLRRYGIRGWILYLVGRRPDTASEGASLNEIIFDPDEQVGTSEMGRGLLSS